MGVPSSNGNSIRAEILSEALPYIQKYNGKVVVVKYGGNAMIDKELKEAVMRDIVLLSLIGVKVILAHGGGPEINEMLRKTGKQSKFVNGLRVTDAETMDIVQMVLAGKTNKDLVSLITKHGGKAMGICGVDAGMVTVERFGGEVDYGQVGEIVGVNPNPVLDLLDKGYIPVLTCIASDGNGVNYNINADTFAARIAAALGAENLILMTDVRGLLRDKDDDATLIPAVQLSEVPNLVKQGIISGGMIPKIECCVEAVRRGVKKAVIIDGRIPHSILIEMLSDEGVGTMFR
ncbi:MAG TPA: acetylglutamate kinase [Candidatus Fimivivens faecavium]|nr:acetylglutamate kinase [Candidatus Fimivivens faecavium]